MKNLDELYFFAEDIIEQALMLGDEATAAIVEEGMEFSQASLKPADQLAELVMALLIIEERVTVPDYSLESVSQLRSTLRGVNSGYTGASRRVC